MNKMPYLCTELERRLAREALAWGPTWRARVLIVDDVSSMRRFLRAVLENSSCLVVAGEACDGSTAVEMAELLQPDVVLLDLSMPGLDGQGALGMLLRVAPGAKVIVVSGMDASIAGSVLDAGATAFLPKGLPPWELLGRIEAIVRRPIEVDQNGRGIEGLWLSLVRLPADEAARAIPDESNPAP